MNTVDAVLLRRDGLVFVDSQPAPRADENVFAAFETEVLALGFTLSADLRAGLQELSLEGLSAFATWLLTQLKAQIGMPNAQPLFRQFPRNIPKNTWRLYVERVLTHWLQQPQQTCLRCGKADSVHPIDPCGHLVCRECWDGSHYSGCPICHRHINPNDPFLKLAPARGVLGQSTAPLRRLSLGMDRAARVRVSVQGLVAKTTPLSPQDRADLLELLKAFGASVFEWLPERIPVKETMAFVLANLFGQSKSVESHQERLRQHLKTATDVLRVLSVWNGEDGSLTPVSKQTRAWLEQIKVSATTSAYGPQQKKIYEQYFHATLNQFFPKQKSFSRATRRALLGILNDLPMQNLLEDMQRHSLRWKRVGEMLHPLEFHRRFPKTALAFALLRRGQVAGYSAALQASLKNAAATPNIRFFNDQYFFVSWANRLEHAISDRVIEALPGLLSERPGEFGRRLDHVLRISLGQPEQAVSTVEAFLEIVLRLTGAMLLQLQAHFACRDQQWPRRIFFPKGEVMLSYAIKDTRKTLPKNLIEGLRNGICEELLRRAGTQAPVATALLDQGVQDLFVPFSERSSSKALVALPRGSTQPIPAGNSLRLFMHWMQSEPFRVDLDLSFSFFDAKWKFMEGCDFTNLCDANGSYIHSGDYTDAPEPDGASEYIDLDLRKLAKRGIRYAMMIVFSYNSVPFDQMPYAFAGIMHRTDKTGDIFEARTVQNRFDLSGNAQIAIPLFVDLQEHRLRWLDVKLTAEGMNHQVGGYHKKLAQIGKDFERYFNTKTRATIWQLACLHAAARTAHVQIRGLDGRIRIYEKGNSSTLEFYERIVALTLEDAILQRPTFAGPAFCALIRGDLEPPAESEVYALHWDALPTVNLVRRTASNLVDALRA
jgi:Prokaryotic RING finger family 4